jgi:DNA-binding NarL/FixJ family response regulator
MVGQTRVLLADDSEDMRRAITALLSEEPAISLIGEVSSYPELMEKLKQSSPDVVVMDIHMPGEDQVDPSMLKRHFNGSCLLAISVWNDEQTRTIAESLGALKLLDKNSLFNTLMPAIEECIQKKDQAANA